MALRVILHARNDEVALRSKRKSSGREDRAGSVENDQGGSGANGSTQTPRLFAFRVAPFACNR